jgi:outer membrane protein OmpA-like peptidoglycan-associated protein
LAVSVFPAGFFHFIGVYMRQLLITILMMVFFLLPSQAQAFDTKMIKFEAGGYLGFHLFDETQDLYNGPGDQVRDFNDVPQSMVLAGGYFGVKYRQFVVEGSLGIIPTKLENSGDFVTIVNPSLAFQYRFENLIPKITPFLKVETGLLGMVADFQGTDLDSIIGGGVGFIYQFKQNYQLRLDLIYFATDSWEESFANNYQARIHFGYTWGGSDDMDGDGISDKDDKCPYKAEDKDNFADDDGCPDHDNDGDGIPDSRDRCPGTDSDVSTNFAKTKEDIDGFEDADGCPEPDNDADGISDSLDKCPGVDADKADGLKKVKEDIDGFEDEDGCPDPDNDGDRVSDLTDQCPGKDANKADMERMKEDIDGFEDKDGCPDPDNDSDGIPDSRDKCPGVDAHKTDGFKKVKEDIDGFEDEDGCPEKGGKQVVIVLQKRVKLLENIYFEYNKARIKQKSHNLLNQVALTLKSRPDLLLLEVQGHAGHIGSEKINLELSKKRAQAVKRYLANRGVSSGRLVVKHYGYSRPLKDCSTVKSRRRRIKCEAKNRRVEFHIVKKRKTKK